MKQITKQYEEQFKKLAPEWFKELKTPLKKGQVTKNPKLNIKSYKCCIVGEIYGFPKYYMFKNNHCIACYELSEKLCNESTLKRNNTLIPVLISHINEYHPELMKYLY